MAINNTTSDFAFMEFPMAFSRQDGFPLDKTCVYGSLAAAQTYAQTSPLAYVGQVLAVVRSARLCSTKSRTPLVRWSRSADSATWVLPPILKYKKCCPRFSRMTITLNRRNQNVLQY